MPNNSLSRKKYCVRIPAKTIRLHLMVNEKEKVRSTIASIFPGQYDSDNFRLTPAKKSLKRSIIFDSLRFFNFSN